MSAKAPAIAALAEPRRTATLLAAVRHLEAAAVDDALDLFDTLMAHRLINAARRASAAERLASLPKLEKASRQLAKAAGAVIGVLEAPEADEAGALDVAAAWSAIEEAVPRAAVAAATAVVAELVPDDDAADAVTRQLLAGRYGVVRPFLELLAQAVPLQATPAGANVPHEVRRRTWPVGG
ncbi:hypothetical protein AB0I28_03645 [Phytomonospora sp. NPDC050363]|uniref:hypothetical protein n=1 Tax=Phytomonospora sp. NPDC050363 TaxID=3155642 RepID=UPI0033F962B5